MEPPDHLLEKELRNLGCVRGIGSSNDLSNQTTRGTYVYLNHNLIEAIAFGATIEVQVEGEWDDNLMKQISKLEKINK